MGTWCAFEARPEACHGDRGHDVGWRRLLADLLRPSSGPGRLAEVLSRPVGVEPQWPVQRLDALWHVAHGRGAGPFDAGG